MKKPTRADIFALAGRKLREDFQELQTVAHAGVKGGEAEDILKEFLSQHLPKRFSAGSGFIIDHKDNITGHNDVIIYDALNCPLYRASENAAIIPNENVAAVIEVKSSLDKAALLSAANKIMEAKSLLKTKPPSSVDIFGNLINYETLGIVFAYDTPIAFDTIAEHYRECFQITGIGPHIDFVFILDKGMMSLGVDPSKTGEWGATILYATPPVEGLHIATTAMELGSETLNSFILLLLKHLQYFRHMVDHPGFNWSTERTGKKIRISYLTSVTGETDPNKREDILAQYREEARRLILGE